MSFVQNVTLLKYLHYTYFYIYVIYILGYMCVLWGLVHTI